MVRGLNAPGCRLELLREVFSGTFDKRHQAGFYLRRLTNYG